MRRLLAACVGAAACGHVDFGDRVPPEASSFDASAQSIEWVGPFASRASPVGTSDTFAAQAAAADDVVLLLATCIATSVANVPDGVTLAAPGWSFTQLTPLEVQDMGEAAAFGAIAPDTSPTEITVTWSSPCDAQPDEIGDEFSGVDPSGGSVTFDAATPGIGTGDCVTSLTTGHTGDALWAACSTGGTLSATGAGFRLGSEDDGDSWAEYRLSTDPAGTAETIEFTNSNDFAMAAVALKPRRRRVVAN